MSMLFVHFQNPQFEKWTLSRVSGIFFYLYIGNCAKSSPPLACSGELCFRRPLPFDKKLHKPTTLCNLFIKEKEIFCKKGRIASKSFLRDVKY